MVRRLTPLQRHDVGLRLYWAQWAAVSSHYGPGKWQERRSEESRQHLVIVITALLEWMNGKTY